MGPRGYPSDNDRGNGLPGLLRWTRTKPYAARITGYHLLLLGGLYGDRANEARKVKFWLILGVKLWPIWNLYGTYELDPAQMGISL